MMRQLANKLQSFFPYKKRHPIEDWDFIFVFEEYYAGEVQILFTSILCQNKFEWTMVGNPKEKQVLFLVRLTDQVVKDMAHELKILKIKNKKSYELKLKDINKLIYTTDKESSPNVYNYLCFLRARMSKGNREIYEQEKYSAFNKNKEHMYARDERGRLFTTEEELRAKYHFLLTYSEKLAFKENPIAVSDSSKEPFNNLMKIPGFIELVPIQKVSEHRTLILGNLKDYVGPNIDCYFQFVSFMQKWLIFPMIVGLLVVGFNNHFGYTADNSPFDFIYALVIMLWSILFITRWQEIQKWTKVKESQGRSQIWTESQEMISRRDFEKHYSNVTGQIQYHLSLKLKILLGIASNLLCFSMMMVTLIFVVYSLNARGFIDPEHKLFYSKTVSGWAAPGGIFDSKTMRGQIPNIIHVMVTNGFDENIYRAIVKKLARFERHESRKGYENSVILKYFIYEFVITFADLFYIAFVRLDIEGLREQLLSLFFIDIVRRVVAETVVPWIIKMKKKRDQLKFLRTAGGLQKKASFEEGKMSEEEDLQWGAIHEVNKEDYQPFDDYLQIISNMGYLVMISSCFPLAPLLILLAHQVQLIQDKYKVIHIFKRKLPQSYVGMGRWKNIIVFICYISIVTNIMLFAFSSQQVVSYFPKLYDSGIDLIYGNTDISTLIGGVTASIMENIHLGDGNVTEGGMAGGLGGGGQVWLPGMMGGDDGMPVVVDRECEEGETSGCSPKPKDRPNPANNNEMSPSPMILKQFKPPKKQSQLTFMAILFFIEHFFLLLFIFIRDLLKRRKSQAEIFLERRVYKRKIKKNLPRDTLSNLTVNMMVNSWILKQAPTSINQEPSQGTKEVNESRFTQSTQNTDRMAISGLASLLKLGSNGGSLKEE